jgi:hypothetical protein
MASTSHPAGPKPRRAIEMELRQSARRVSTHPIVLVLVAAILVALMLGVVGIGLRSQSSTVSRPHVATGGVGPDLADRRGDPYSPHDPIGAPIQDPYSPHDSLVK